MSGPRLSIIPAGAVIDPRLEGRDLQVLALLGSHIDEEGWCFRSQARMAKQIGCGRATVQRSLDRLEIAGWLARRAETRKDGGDTANSYRVILDVAGAAPGEEEDQSPPSGLISDPDDSPPASPVRRGPPAHGRAGILTTPNERNERERGREDLEIPDPDMLARFRRDWPTTTIDRPKAVETAWRALTDDERRLAVTSIAAVLAARKAAGRSHALGGPSYLADRAWEPVLAAGGAKAVAPAEPDGYARPFTRRFWACVIWAAMGGATRDVLAKRRRLAESNVGWPIAPGAMRDAVDETDAKLVATPSDGRLAGAWSAWLASRGFDFQDRLAGKPFYVFLPEHPPPGWLVSENADELADGL